MDYHSKIEGASETIKALNQDIRAGNVIIIDNDVYCWWLPRSSPMSQDGGWYKLKTIESPANPWSPQAVPTSMWTKLPVSGFYKALATNPDDKSKCNNKGRYELCPQEIIDHIQTNTKYRVALMKDTLYGYNPDMDGRNFSIYSKGTDNNPSLISTDIHTQPFDNVLYYLSDNSAFTYPIMDSWTDVSFDHLIPDVSFDHLQTENLPYTNDNQPRTPLPTKSGNKTLTNDDSHTTTTEPPSNATLQLIEASYATSESDSFYDSDSYSSTTEGLEHYQEDSEEHYQEDSEEDSEDETVSGSEYQPSEATDSSSNMDDDEYYDEYYDEYREDLNGVWYTRRQFYDYYGSDEAWDNLDPSTFHTHRYDELDGNLYTQEEFYQYYGSYDVWDNMDPKKLLQRRTLYSVYHYASYIHPTLQGSFIVRMMNTYN
jgi:hypothetical protein